MKLAKLCSAALMIAFTGCTDDKMSVGDDQTPPTSGGEVETWLTGGAYKGWACETVKHAPRSPSPHPMPTSGFNRICSNNLIANAATGTGVWPKGAAAVKEMFNSDTDTAPAGYAVYLKTADDSAGGNNWYWYEKIGTTKVADGKAVGLCVSCHTAAGSDAAHTPSTGGRDQVYTPVH
jgi:hypothetical protein